MTPVFETGVVTNMFFLTLIFFGFNELFRRFNLLALGVFGLLPVLLIPVLISQTTMSWFGWAKLYSACLPVVLLQAMRFTRLASKKPALLACWGLLSLNILEAALRDAQNGNILNAVVGLILILTLPGPYAISIDKVGRYKDFLWDIPFTWSVVFTIWDWVFVYASYGRYAHEHFVVLLVPLVLAIARKEIWVQARIFTFAPWMLGTVISVEWLKIQWIPQVQEFDQSAYHVLVGISLLAGLVHLVYLARTDGIRLLRQSWQRAGDTAGTPGE